eukprot:7063483-Prymnesium_polylepis.1
MKPPEPQSLALSESLRMLANFEPRSAQPCDVDQELGCCTLSRSADRKKVCVAPPMPLPGAESERTLTAPSSVTPCTDV